jgi:hypothetical protein
LTLSETASALSAITMPLTANEANEQLNDDRKDQGKNSRYEKSIPFRQPLPSRQWKPDEWFDPSIQKTNFWFDRMPLTPH